MSSELPQSPLKEKSEWQPDQAAVECHNCASPFTLFKRRHHCRFCGLVVCDNCSQRRLAAPDEPKVGLRACTQCYRAAVGGGLSPRGASVPTTATTPPTPTATTSTPTATTERETSPPTTVTADSFSTAVQHHRDPQEKPSLQTTAAQLQPHTLPNEGNKTSDTTTTTTIASPPVASTMNGDGDEKNKKKNETPSEPEKEESREKEKEKEKEVNKTAEQKLESLEKKVIKANDTAKKVTAWTAEAKAALTEIHSLNHISAVAGKAAQSALNILAEHAPWPIDSAFKILGVMASLAAKAATNRDECNRLTHRSAILLCCISEANEEGFSPGQGRAIASVTETLKQAQELVASFTPDAEAGLIKRMISTVKLHCDQASRFASIHSKITQATQDAVFAMTTAVGGGSHHLQVPSAPSTEALEASLSAAFGELSQKLEQQMEALSKRLLNGVAGGMITPGRIVLEKDAISEGASGKVFGGLLDGQHAIAVKYPQGPGELARLQQEASVALKLQHPYVVKIHGMVTDDAGTDVVGLVMERLTFCLADLISPDGRRVASSFRLSNAAKLNYMVQLCKAMDALHTSVPDHGAIIFQDLKPQNIMVTADKTTCKLIDFGTAVERHTSQGRMDTKAISGTVNYMSPESLDAARYSELGPPTDVYSFAMVAYALWTGKEPWVGVGDRAIQGSVIEGKRPPINSVGEVPPPAIATLIQLCWSHRAADRPTFGELKAIGGSDSEALLCASELQKSKSNPAEFDPAYPRFLRLAFEAATLQRAAAAAASLPQSSSGPIGSPAPLQLQPTIQPLGYTPEQLAQMQANSQQRKADALAAWEQRQKDRQAAKNAPQTGPIYVDIQDSPAAAMAKSKNADVVIVTNDGNISEIPDMCLANCKAKAFDFSQLKGIVKIGDKFMVNCTEMTTLDVSSLHSVRSIGKMFLGNCSGLQTLDLRPLGAVGEVVGGSEVMGKMLANTKALQSVMLPSTGAITRSVVSGTCKARLFS